MKLLSVSALLVVFSGWWWPAENGITLLDNRQRSAADLFKKHCSSCHGRDGRAKTLKSRLRYHARDLTDAAWQESVTDERIFNSIFNGRGKMPAFGKKLNQTDVEELVKHVRAFRR